VRAYVKIVSYCVRISLTIDIHPKAKLTMVQNKMKMEGRRRTERRENQIRRSKEKEGNEKKRE
jgi:hypothetical protein